MSINLFPTGWVKASLVSTVGWVSFNEQRINIDGYKTQTSSKQLAILLNKIPSLRSFLQTGSDIWLVPNTLSHLGEAAVSAVLMSGIWYRVMGAGITRENSTQLSNEFSSDQYTQDYIHITSHTRGGALKNSRLSNSRDWSSPIFALYLWLRKKKTVYSMASTTQFLVSPGTDIKASRLNE